MICCLLVTVRLMSKRVRFPVNDFCIQCRHVLCVMFQHCIQKSTSKQQETNYERRLELTTLTSWSYDQISTEALADFFVFIKIFLVPEKTVTRQIKCQDRDRRPETKPISSRLAQTMWYTYCKRTENKQPCRSCPPPGTSPPPPGPTGPPSPPLRAWTSLTTEPAAGLTSRQP